jgi:ribonuclease D
LFSQFLFNFELLIIYLYDYVGYAIDKKLATSNWSRNPLTDEQVNYAATDAYLHQRIYQELKEISENNEKVSVLGNILALANF